MKKIATGLLTTALFAMVVAPASAWSFDIIGNGTDSENDIRVRLSSRYRQEQTNIVQIGNEIEVESNTGGNETNDNTGGDVDSETGDTNTTITVVNAGGTNVDEGDDCECVDLDEDSDIEIKENGSDSENEVRFKRSSIFSRYQHNFFGTFNGIDVDSNTGDNETDDNTGGEGGDDVDSSTGDTTVDIYVENVGAANEDL